MQLCKCINCFLKAHNKQLNQYCLNFIIFFTKKKVLKKWFGFGSGRELSRVDPHKTWVESRVNPFCFGSKNRVRIGYFSGQVGSGRVRKFWPVLPCLPIITIILQHSQCKLTRKNSLFTFYRCSDTNNRQASQALAQDIAWMSIHNSL